MRAPSDAGTGAMLIYRTFWYRQVMPGKEFLLFEDYLESPDPHGWVTVAGTDDCDRDSKYVFSALATMGSADPLLKTVRPEVHATWCMPTFVKTDGEVVFDPDDLYLEGDIRIEPFVFRQGHACGPPNAYEVAQGFTRYHDLRFDREKRAYVDCDGEEIVRVWQPHMYVREDALRDYLAARKMVLVLYYNHIRRASAGTAELLGKERVDRAPKAKDANYRIVAADWKGGCLSKLLGKRIVRPYAKPRHRDYALAADDPEKYMAYKCLENGEPVEKSCDVESGRQPGPFLTPVFFKKEALSKYYDSRRYTVSKGVIGHRGLWNLPFGENGDLAHVWLGDLGRIPYDEQMHWRQYNVMPRGGMEENFVRRQVRGEFAESRSGCEILLDLGSKANAGFERRFRFGLFVRPPPKDARLHDLASNEEREFDAQILDMAKIFIESINAADLAQGAGQSADDDPIENLRRFLAKAGLEPDKAAKIADAFCAVRNLRNGAAHRKGRKYARHLRRLGLEKAEPRDRFAKVVAAFAGQLAALDGWLAQE